MATAMTLSFFSLDARSASPTEIPPGTPQGAAEIQDLFAFADKDQLVMAMTFASPEQTFSTANQYVFHTSSGEAFGKTTSSTNVICTFASAQSVSCWVGEADYVTGDPSRSEVPLTSASGKLRVFAGLRADPRFFNLSGFVDTVAIVKGAAGALTFDSSGCPAVDGPTSSALVATLRETGSKANPARTNPDDFFGANALSLVVAVDRALVASAGSIVSVWASTNKAQ